MNEPKELLTVNNIAVAMLAIAAALVALLILAITFVLARRYFAKCPITDRRKKVLTFLLVFIATLTVFTAVFSPILYEIAYCDVAANPEASLKTILPAAIKTTMYFAVPMVFVISLLILTVSVLKKPRETYFTTKTVTRLAVFSALSVVLYLFAKFNLPIFPGFLDVQISDMPALLAGFMMGPQGGAVVIIIRALIKLPFTTTGGVGELGDLILGLVFVLSSSIIYKKLRTKGAVIALLVGAISCTVAALIVNRFILIPFFATLYSWNAVVGMVKSLYPSITQENFYTFYLLAGALPFNILRCAITCLAAFLLYRPTKLAFGFVGRKAAKKTQNS